MCRYLFPLLARAGAARVVQLSSFARLLPNRAIVRTPWLQARGVGVLGFVVVEHAVVGSPYRSSIIPLALEGSALKRNEH